MQPDIAQATYRCSQLSLSFVTLDIVFWGNMERLETNLSPVASIIKITA